VIIFSRSSRINQFAVPNAVVLQLPTTCVRRTITMKIVKSFNPVTSSNCCKNNNYNDLAKISISMLADSHKKSRFLILILRSSQIFYLENCSKLGSQSSLLGIKYY